MIFNRPKVAYPTVVSGIVCAPTLRLECLDGNEMGLSADIMRLYPDFIQSFPGVSYDGKNFGLRNAGPFVLNGKVWGITHLQKYATSFSLLYDPFIYHHWVGEPPKKNPDGTWIPGSEKGNLWLGGYWRTPGWRWQKPDENSNWTPWILSGGRIPGSHLD